MKRPKTLKSSRLLRNCSVL